MANDKLIRTTYGTGDINAKTLDGTEYTIPDVGKYPTNLELIGSQHKRDIKNLLKNELVFNGIPVEEVSQYTTAGMIIQGFNTHFDYASSAINNIKLESSLLYCRKKANLYNQLAQVNGEVVLAQPSTVPLYIQIPYENLIKIGTNIGNNTYEVVFGEGNIIILDSLEFIPKETYYIRIQVVATGQYVLRVFTINSDNSQDDIVAQEYISVNGDYILVFPAEFIQITKTQQQFTFKNSQLDLFVLRTTYPINNFFMTYVDILGRKREIEKKLYVAVDNNEYMQYKILDANIISLEYKYVPGGFKAEQGGKLLVDILETSGLNIKYRGDASIKSISPTGLIIDYMAYGGDGLVYESSGGVVTANEKEQLRTNTIILKGTRKAIDTEPDMDTFLMSYYTGGSKFKSKLIVNNTLTRIWNINTILSLQIGNYNFTLPTDSGDVTLDLDNLPSRSVDGTDFYAYNNENIIHSVQTSLSPDYTYIYTPGDDDYINNTDNENYFYNIPFLITYDKVNNFCRVFSDTQYDDLYPTVVIDSNTVSSEVFTRYVNTSLRVYDYYGLNEDVNPSVEERLTYIIAPFRSNNYSVPLVYGENFKAYLKVTDINGVEYKIKGELKVVSEADSLYEMKFSYTTDRLIYKDRFDMTFMDYTTNTNLTKTFFIVPEICELVFESGIEDPLNPGTFTFTVTSKHKCDTLSFFKDITKYIYLQSTINKDNGNLILKQAPLVLSSFYVPISKNRLSIYNELTNIFKFLETKVYALSGVDAYSSSGKTLDDMQDTLFTASIKFIKSSGRSRKFNILGYTDVPVVNLQIRPQFFITKLNKDFDENAISSYVNDRLINHKYISSNLSMDNVSATVLTSSLASIKLLQFVAFDKDDSTIYDLRNHIVRQNEYKLRNFDTPEVLSIEPYWDENLQVYRFNVEYLDK